MPKAFSYIRFSSSQQAGGDSLRRQLARSRRFAEERGLELNESRRDLASSAFHNRHADTGHLAGFLAMAREGEIEPGSYFLIESFDRLSRDEFWPAFDLIRDILRARIIIVTLPAGEDPREYSYESTTKDPRQITEIIFDLTRAHSESKWKSDRCSEVAAEQRAAARTGEVKIPGRVHAWLKPIRRDLESGRMATVGFELLPEPAAAIRRMFELALSGLGERAVAAQLNRENVPGLTPGVGWHHSTVKQVLKSPGVIGIKQPGRMVNGKSTPDGGPLLDYYPRIISDGDYYRAQAMRKARKRRGAGRKGATISNLLSGLTRCAQCGAPLLFVHKGLSRRGVRTASSRYLVCTNARRSFNCTNKAKHHYEPLERDVLTLLSMFDLSRLVSVPDADAARGAALEAEHAAKLERLKHLAEFGDLTEVGAVMRKLNEEVKDLARQIEDHRRDAKVAEAEASRDAHAEFLALVAKINSGDMSEDELRILRSKLAQEIRRRIEEIVGDGPNITASLKVRPGYENWVVPLPMPAVGVLPAWEVEGLRMLPHAEPPPIGEVWTPEELEAWKARG